MDNNVLNLLQKIKALKAKLYIEDGNLKLKIDEKTRLPDELSKEISLQKENLIKFLSKTTQKSHPIPRASLMESYPLSNSQKALWIQSHFEGGSEVYSISSSLIIEIKNLFFFKEAIKKSVERHEILRTVFKENEEGEIRQWIINATDFEFDIVIKKVNDFENNREKIDEFINKDKYVPFDVKNGPLFRIYILELEKDNYIFYYNMHHIISDGWSLDVLAKDVSQIYMSLILNKPIDLTPLSIQYKDFVMWQMSLENSKSIKESQTFWKEELSGELPILELPIKKRRPKIKTFSGNRICTKLTKEQSNKLRKFTSDRGGSVFMGLLTVFKVLLYRYTNEKNIIVGNPVSGRDHLDLKDQIGYYLNVIILKNELNPNDTFTECFHKIKDKTLNTFKHRAYPFNRVIEDLDLNRDISRNPVYDILIDYHGTVQSSITPNIEAGLHDLGPCMIKFDLEFDPSEHNEGIDLLFGYNTDVYTKDIIENFIQHYKNLVLLMLDENEESIGKIKFLSSNETSKLLVDFNSISQKNFAVPSILEAFEEYVNKTPKATMLVFENQELTYEEVEKKTNQLAHYLKGIGVKKNTLIPICFENPLQTVLAILSVLKANAAYVPLDVNLPQERINFIINDVNSSYILTDFMFEDLFEDFIDDKIIIFLNKDSDKINNSPETSLTIEYDSNQLFYIIYTSGTTGVPKGVIIIHKNITDYFSGLLTTLKISKGQSFALMSTPSADLGNTFLFGSIISGGTLHLFSKETLISNEKLKSYFNDNEIDFIKVVPSHWHSLCDENEIILPNKAILFGGETISIDSIKKIQKENPKLKIINHYGPTETTIGKLMYRVDASENRFNIPVGKPFSNTKIYVLNEFLGLCPIGVKGNLYIGGEGVGKGYLNQPELTKERFILNNYEANDTIYNTGDIVRWLSDGNIEFSGRLDDQVKIRGYRVELKEIETILNELDNIKQSIVRLKEDNKGNKHIVAYLVLNEFASSKSVEEGVRLILEEKLPDYMIPTYFEVLEKIPLKITGKLDEEALPELKAFYTQKSSCISPTTPTEKKLVEIWSEVLNIETISIDDDFFLLGGNSLTAIQILNRIKKTIEIEIAIKDLFQFKSIQELAYHLDFSQNNNKIKSNNTNLKITKI